MVDGCVQEGGADLLGEGAGVRYFLFWVNGVGGVLLVGGMDTTWVYGL